ncbi:MAG: hypothetical protein FVQ83_06915 [Chloroflexi bacterium]|nr:hypothetical protein [Chloroflexota bacterium]
MQPTSGESFYVEATLATDMSVSKAGAQARVNQFYDAINRLVDSQNFNLMLDIEGTPNTPPRARAIASKINSWLAELDPDELVTLYDAKGMDALPHLDYSHGGWRISVRPSPKRFEARGKAKSRAIGLQHFGFRLVDHKPAIRKAVIKKAGRYQELDLPYIIAVNALEHIDKIDSEEALFGTEQFTIKFSVDTTASSDKVIPSRLPDGAWTSPSGYKNKRVSAVLLVSRLTPWSVPKAAMRLYHHPEANKPYSSVLTRLPQAELKENKIIQLEGKLTGEIFTLPPAWPEDAG